MLPPPYLVCLLDFGLTLLPPFQNDRAVANRLHGTQKSRKRDKIAFLPCCPSADLLVSYNWTTEREGNGNLNEVLGFDWDIVVNISVIEVRLFVTWSYYRVLSLTRKSRSNFRLCLRSQEELSPQKQQGEKEQSGPLVTWWVLLVHRD